MLTELLILTNCYYILQSQLILLADSPVYNNLIAILGISYSIISLNDMYVECNQIFCFNQDVHQHYTYPPVYYLPHALVYCPQLCSYSMYHDLIMNSSRLKITGQHDLTQFKYIFCAVLCSIYYLKVNQILLFVQLYSILQTTDQYIVGIHQIVYHLPK